jgi:hypothetical protein
MTPPAMTVLRDKPSEVVGEEKRSDTINYLRARTEKRARDAAETAIYLRNIQQAEMAVKMRLPPCDEMSSMPCFPKWKWLVGSIGARFRGATRRLGAMRCIAPPRYVR